MCATPAETAQTQPAVRHDRSRSMKYTHLADIDVVSLGLGSRRPVGILVVDPRSRNRGRAAVARLGHRLRRLLTTRSRLSCQTLSVARTVLPRMTFAKPTRDSA